MNTKFDCFWAGCMTTFIGLGILAQVGMCVTEVPEDPAPEAIATPAPACPPAPPVHVEVSCGR